jgi:hypothetical protein
MAINRWWEHQPNESFWLEITQREDLGSDLHAPQTNESGKDYWSYSLVCEVQDGDIVFHYSKRDHAISLWSRADGGWWDDEIFWGARGTVGRVNDPYDRPGWVHGLDGPFPTSAPLTLPELRQNEKRLSAIRDELEADHEPPLYFPFELGQRRELRPAQGYLFKLPAAVVEAFPSLERPAAEQRRVSRGTPRSRAAAPPPADDALGTTYRRPDENAPDSHRDPFEVDPSVVDRGVRGHRIAQNALADHLMGLGIEPRSPKPSEPQFDLAWISAGEAWVAEVKSLTRKNEERQLRLGLGQLLRYRDLLGPAGAPAKALLMAEREPRDTTWASLCTSLGVLLAWPESLPKQLRRDSQ